MEGPLPPTPTPTLPPCRFSASRNATKQGMFGRHSLSSRSVGCQDLARRRTIGVIAWTGTWVGQGSSVARMGEGRSRVWPRAGGNHPSPPPGKRHDWPAHVESPTADLISC